MVLAANLAVLRFGLENPWPWVLGLVLSVLLVYAVEPASLAGLPLWERGSLGSLVNALPIGFAGVVVSLLLSSSKNPAAALGSNLLGSVLGGGLEYLSMVVGLRALALLALVLYLAAILLLVRARKAAAA